MTIAEAISEIAIQKHPETLKWSLAAARMGQRDVLCWLLDNGALPYLPDEVKTEVYGYVKAEADSGDEYAQVMHAYFLMIGYGCQRQEYIGRNILVAFAKKMNQEALYLLGCLPPCLDWELIETEEDLMQELLEYPWGPYRCMSIENCLHYDIGTQCYIDSIATLSKTPLQLNHEDHLDVEEYIYESEEGNNDENVPF